MSIPLANLADWHVLLQHHSGLWDILHHCDDITEQTSTQALDMEDRPRRRHHAGARRRLAGGQRSTRPPHRGDSARAGCVAEAFSDHSLSEFPQLQILRRLKLSTFATPLNIDSLQINSAAPAFLSLQSLQIDAMTGAECMLPPGRTYQCG
jgi:hypothetical protein